MSHRRSLATAFRAGGAAALAACAAACVTPDIGVQGRAIRVSGDYVHPATGARLPERLGGLARAGVTSWDEAESNVGVSYDEGARVRITVYLYPAGDARTGRLRGEFLETHASLEQFYPAALRERGAVVRAPAPDGRAVGFEARFKLLDAERARATLAQVFQCGAWFLKLRASYAADYPIDGALDAVHDQVSCRELTLHDPIGTARTIDFDPEGGAEWLAYGASQLNWVAEHVAPEDLAYGIPDHDPALFVEAWEATLDVRAELRAKGEADANPFLDRMLEVQSAGFLHEYVWSEYLAFLEPPAELAPRLEEFARWRERSIPAHRHEVHAGARLRRSE